MNMFVKQEGIDVGLWTESISELGVDRYLGLTARQMAEYITCDSDELYARQNIYRDCLRLPRVYEALMLVRDSLESLERIAKNEQTYSTEIERTLYEFAGLGVYIDLISFLADTYDLVYDSLSSERLSEFFAVFHETVNSELFIAAKGLISGLETKLKVVKSVTIGVNLNASLEPCEMGILSTNEKYFTSSNVFTSFFAQKDAFAGRVSPFIGTGESDKLLERSLYHTLNKNICRALKKSQRELMYNVREMVSPLFGCRDDIAYICASVRALKKLVDIESNVLCWAEISRDSTALNDAYDLNLLRNMSCSVIVKNKVSFASDGAGMYILTGANSGGKSVYVRTVGVCQVMGQLGMCITAKNGRIKPVEKLFTHFPAKQSEGASRFVLECRKMKGIIEKLSENCLLLMDETFSSTDSAQGAAVAYQVMRHVQSKNCFCVFSTHILEMKSYFQDLNIRTPQIHALCVQNTAEMRYKIVPGFVNERNYAYDIAKRYGLEFEE